MSNYRINVRFNMEDERERKAAEYLQAIYSKERKSRNRFIVDAIIANMGKAEESDLYIQSIKAIFREVIQEYGQIPISETKATVTNTELTEEEEAENALSVLQDLEMFG